MTSGAQTREGRLRASTVFSSVPGTFDAEVDDAREGSYSWCCEALALLGC
jgi:hypothetical protein